MKKLFNVLPFFFLVLLASCGGDDDDENNNGNDVTITSKTSKIGISYAIIEGYINLDVISGISSLQTLGVEVSETEDFTTARKYFTDGIEGKKISVMVNELEASTKYYYRTFMNVNNLNYYSAKQSFTTKDFSNITSTGAADQITENSAVITSTIDGSSIDPKEKIIIGIAYSLSESSLHKDSLFMTSENEISQISINNGQFETTLYNLELSRTYYYCSFTKVGQKYKLGEIKSFTTNIGSFEGTWRGNMYVSVEWDGRVYDSDYSDVCFLRDLYRYPSGAGYWVDHFKNSGWGQNYMAYHIEWTVNYGRIKVYFVEDGSSIFIEDYKLDGNYFVGVVNDGQNRVDFVLRHVSSPNWNDYYYGWDTYYYAKENNWTRSNATTNSVTAPKRIFRTNK